MNGGVYIKAAQTEQCQPCLSPARPGSRAIGPAMAEDRLGWARGHQRELLISEGSEERPGRFSVAGLCRDRWRATDSQQKRAKLCSDVFLLTTAGVSFLASSSVIGF